MNQSKILTRKALWFSGIALALTLISVILRLVSLLCFFDSEIGYYTAGTILPLLSNLTTAIAVLFFGVVSLARFGNFPFVRKPASLTLRMASVLVALAFVWLSVSDLLTKRAVFPFLLGLLAAAYFVLIAVKIESPSLRVVGCIGALARILVALGHFYFDVTIPMNAPDKVLFELACAISVLFLVCDLRASLAEPRPALFRFSTATATLLLAASALPSLLAVKKQILADSYTESYLLLAALFVYAAVKTVELTLPDKEVEVSEPTQPIGDATDRTDENTTND